MPSGFRRIALLCFINQFSKKNDIGWLQQPPTEKVLKFTLDLLAPDLFKIMLSKGGSLSGNYDFLAISTHKNTFFTDLD